MCIRDSLGMMSLFSVFRRNTENNDIIPRRVGVLKTNVPNWLANEPVNSKILQTTEAHVRHGGGGAYYVYLKKKK